MLLPRTARFLPTAQSRGKAWRTIRANPPEKFETYTDWFYFVHVDPMERVIHLVGMFLGLYLFALALLALSQGEWLWAGGYGLTGIVPFYYFGVASHFVYDRGAAESDPAYWWPTLFTVVYINLATGLGLYDRTLRTFLRRYPWVEREWDLVDVGPVEALRLMLGRV